MEPRRDISRMDALSSQNLMHVLNQHWQAARLYLVEIFLYVMLNACIHETSKVYCSLYLQELIYSILRKKN